MRVEFSEKANSQFNRWLVDDKKIYVKIIDLIESIANTPFKGIGKPESLKGNLSGFWSRRINIEHRLVYKIEKDVIYIVQCKYHY
ncbi:MAG: Txe/YoeB family addiction module toxin [Flavobacteriales bacterium CG_4_9_14_3_um_filter_32_8]|nr:MAG: Txe/YoeB family addiction module toxin [Flavobacteriales bacterium CG_4_9_14_3_um_filter_32_8]